MYRFFRYCELLDSATSTARSDIFTLITSARALHIRCTGRWWVDCARHTSLLEDNVRDDITVVVVVTAVQGLPSHVCRVSYFTRKYHELWRQRFEACRFHDVGQTLCRQFDSFDTDINIFSLRRLKTLHATCYTTKLNIYRILHKISVSKSWS